MPEQVDIAVDLGVVAPPLPGILTLRQLVETAPAPPHEAAGITGQPASSGREGASAHHAVQSGYERQLGRLAQAKGLA
jgi:hypothetical protein